MRRSRKYLYGTDSKFELELKTGILSHCEYHPANIAYTVPSTDHKYEPDFRWDGNGEGIVYFIEAKGRFADTKEALKYIYVREHLKKNEELVFLFMKPYQPMPGAQKRKDGTYRTHKEWAETNNFKWFTKDTIGEIL